jgi:glycosyltransferase involved in cell wall biosynthesis
MPQQRSILFGPLPPPYGGVSVFMSGLCDHVIARGGAVWYYKGKPGVWDTKKGYTYVNHRRLSHLWALAGGGRQARITDSTHFHLEYPHPLLLPLWLLAKSLLGFSWIKVLHDGSLPERYESFSGMQKRLFKASMRNIDEFVVSGGNLAAWLKDVAGAEKKITTIPVLLPPPPGWGTAPVDPGMVNRLDRFAAHGGRVSSIGVFIPSYGFHHVADAVEKIRLDTGDDVGLLLVDGQFACDSNYREMVLKDRDWIEVVENIPHPALGRVYESSDVFVRAFEHESYGLSRVEALWCGTPVVATRPGETRGMRLYDFGDVEQLQNHIRALLNGGPDVDDIKYWREVYDAEADINLGRYIKVIAGTGEINAD